MAFSRLHDRALGNVKLLVLSDGAFRMWACALIHCQDNLTDGFVAAEVLDTFRVRANRAAVIRELTVSRVTDRAPLWKAVKGGYQIHDFLDWNLSAAQIRAGRERLKERQAKWRERAKQRVALRVSNGVTKRGGRNAVTNGGSSTSTSYFVRSDRARARGGAQSAPKAEDWIDKVGYCFHTPRCTDSDVCRRKRNAEKAAKRGA